MKFTFVKQPSVHLIASTESNYSRGLGADLKKRGADINVTGMELFDDFLPPTGSNNPATSAERLCEFAGKLCYNAFGKNGSTSTTEGYLSKNVYNGVPYGHYSIAYHAHMTFYITGISRRLSHELLRHYIGIGASEGSPSQMSTRYVIHPARFVVHPRWCDNAIDDTESANSESVDLLKEYIDFKKGCKRAYRQYARIAQRADNLRGLPKKRILEAAAEVLPQAVETTLLMTFNPISLRKMIIERTGLTSDLEFKRLAEKMRDIAEERYSAFKFR